MSGQILDLFAPVFPLVFFSCCCPWSLLRFWLPWFFCCCGSDVAGVLVVLTTLPLFQCGWAAFLIRLVLGFGSWMLLSCVGCCLCLCSWKFSPLLAVYFAGSMLLLLGFVFVFQLFAALFRFLSCFWSGFFWVCASYCYWQLVLFVQTFLDVLVTC